MGVNQWLGLVVITALLCAQIRPGAGTGSTFDFLYNENGDEGSVHVVDEELTLNGSYIDLGQWPHWCLGNIFSCTAGISLNIWVKFKTVSEDTSGIIIFSSGGHTWYSNGIYLMQRYGNEYEIGVALSEALWTVRFRIIPEMWTNIYVAFDTVSGLNVMVDGSMHENPDPGDRFYQPLQFEAFQDVVVGLNLDGSPHTEGVRFEIAKLQVFDWQSTIARPAYNDIGEDLLWLRCGPFTPEFQSPVADTSTALMDCRYICSSTGFTVAALYSSETCACAKLPDIEAMTSDLSSCADSEWRFYTASALQQANAYTISVSVVRLGTREYTKPLESVKIVITQNFIITVPFTVDFGDGTIMEVNGNEITYFWLSEGAYNIDVFAKIGTVEITGSVDFKVENVDENNAGDYAILQTYHGETSNVANIGFTSIDHSTAACNLQFGEVTDVVDLKLNGLTDYVVYNMTVHKYLLFGHYNLLVNCMNSYGTINNKTTFTAQKLDTTFHYHTNGTPFVTEMAGDASFYDQLDVTHNDPDLNVSLSHNASNVIIRSELLRINENFLTYNYGEKSVDKRIISVQNILDQPAVTSRHIDGAWNLTTNITVRVPAGNSMYLNVSFSYGEDQLFYIHYLPAPSNIVFEIIFPSLGYYPVTATLSNDISNSTDNLLVSVEVPIVSIALQVADITNKASPIKLLINLNDGDQGPMKVNFDVDFGNGVVLPYFTHSKSYFFKTYEVDYHYPDWGNYDICVRAYNRITSVIDCTPVQVGQKVTYIDIQMPSSARYYVNEIAKAMVRSPKGSDRSYLVDFGDGEVFVFTDQYLKDTEKFDPTTTTTTTTSTTMAPSTTAKMTSTTPSTNGTNVTAISNENMSFDNMTLDSNKTLSADEFNTNNTEGTLNVRRKRETNDTQEDTQTSTTSQSSSTSYDSTTKAPMTNTSFEFGNATDEFTSENLNSTSLNATTSPTTTSTSTTPRATTTTQPPTTTTMFIPPTMAPVPDNHSTPDSTNDTFARRLRDGRIELTHKYTRPGTFGIKVSVFNHFNWASDNLCPHVVVDTATNTTCTKPALTILSTLVSSKDKPLQFFRSDQINLTATAELIGCGDCVATFSWRTLKYENEEGRVIEKQYHGDNNGICLLEDTEKIFRYRRSSLPFGKYRVRLVVSPSSFPGKATVHDFYIQVNPSAPRAIIRGNNEHKWFLVYGTTMINFAQSVDPDFHTTDGIEYDLVCMVESKMYELKKNGTRASLIQQSTLVKEDITFKYTSKNPVRLYEYTPCFKENANMTRDIRFPKGEFNIPAEYFVSSVPSFAVRLYVTKNNMTTHADITFEIRLSNSSNLLDQLDDLLASKDTTGVMRAVEALSASLLPPPSNGTEEDEDFELQEQVTDLKTKLIGALDSVSEGVKDIGQAAGMLGLVDDLTKDSSSVSESARVGATSAIKNSATVTEEFADEPLDSLTTVGSKVVSGVSNVLPKEDETLKKLAEHEKNIALAEHDRKAVLGPEEGEEEEGEEETPETDGADITLDETEELTQLTEEDILSNAPLPYNKLLKKCNLLHGRQLDKLYKYIFFYESIFRHVLKNFSEEIMISADILKLKRNDIFCYIGVLEEPADVEWYVNRLCDDEKRRRDLIRKNSDRKVSQSFLGAIDSMSSVLINKTEGNQTVEMNAKGLKVAMKKSAANGTEDSDSMVSGGAGIKMPAVNMDESGNGTEVGQTLIINDQSPFTYANENDTTEVGTSVVTFKLSTPGTKDEVKVSNSTEPIEIYLAGNPEKVQEPMLNTLLVKQGESGTTMNFHSINVTKNDTTLHIIVRPQFDDSVDLFEIFIQYEDYPNDTHHLSRTVLPLSEDAVSPNATEEQIDVLRHTFFPEASLTKLAGIYKVGVRLRSGNIDFNQDVTAFNYTWQMFLGGCRFWNDVNETWDSDGCIVGNMTTYNSTQCLCTHLTSFGGEMVVPPNTIDFNNVWAKFKDLNENAAVFSTVVALLGLYVIGLIWARHMDKKDVIKWGASPLEDNLPTDNYHYQISVYTGLKKQAGTKSNISFIISGETYDTGVRRLFDGKRKTHGRGSIMNYILSVENKLGPLSFCRVWHDNSGDSKNRSWFLDQLEVIDLQTGERYYFLCNRWLAVEEDDGMVDRILPVAGIEDLVAFKQLFSSSIRKKLTSDHLWLSVFTRPTRSKFTRVQRISCCTSLLFLTMITNAMWFKGDGESETNSNQQVVSLKLGPFSFTLQQVFISLASTIIVFPPSFMLITLFRRTKQKKNTVMQTNQRLPKRGKWKNLGGAGAGTQSRSNMWEDEPKTSRFKKFKASVQALVRGSGNSSKYDTAAAADDDDDFDSIPQATIAGDPSAKKNKQKKKKKPFMFPHWCSYIAWILCFFSIITPAFFTILYSMEWGATKANQWLTTFVLSFFQSVIVVQPIKVLCLVAFIACVLKKPDLDDDGDCTDELNNAIAAHDEELTNKGADVIDEIARKRRQANEEFEPPDTAALETSRLARIKEMKMEEILKEICVYGFFALVLFFLSYQQRDKASFDFATNLKNMFLGKFENIRTVLDYWVWLEKFFLPTLYAAKFHNGTNMTAWWDKRCISDYQSYRMGIGRMRQFRIKEDSCKIVSTMEPEINHCRNDYNWYDDDTEPYLPAWVKTSKENQTLLDERRDDPFVYQNSIRLKNAPYLATLQTYKGGGYVINFERSFRRTKRNLTRLRSEDWLDLRTRAIILEFTVYNPNSNLFASAQMTTEFPSYGAAVPRSEFKVFRLQSYVGGFAIVVILFEVLYCCFTIFFFVRCIKKVKKEKCKYFKTFWDILEFVMLCFGVSCIAMYAFKHILTEVAFNSLHKQSKAEYVNFQSLALYDEMYGYMTAIVVFLASIQFLKLLQFNKKMNMLGDTVKLATKDLKVFSVAFLLYFFAFVVTGYLLFGQSMAGYNGFIQSAESSFAFTLGAFDFDAMAGAQKFLGPLFFFAFIAVIYVGLMSIFLTIIGDAFTTVKEQTQNAQNEYEMVDFIWRKFKGIIGVK